MLAVSSCLPASVFLCLGLQFSLQWGAGVCHHLHHVTGIVAPVTDSVYSLTPSACQLQVCLAHWEEMHAGQPHLPQRGTTAAPVKNSDRLSQQVKSPARHPQHSRPAMTMLGCTQTVDGCLECTLCQLNVQKRSNRAGAVT